jgi:hydrogenase expression/formation protein HypC
MRLLIMCLGIPMKIKKIEGELAQVETGRLLRTINIQMLLNVKIGDFVIVHAGFAIQKLNNQEARKTLDLLKKSLSKN